MFSSHFFKLKKIWKSNLCKQHQSNTVLLAVFSLFSQFKKIQQASPGAVLPKLPQLLASFPALPLCCFLLRKILTKITNETSACCKLGHKVMERYLVTIRQQFPEKKLYSTFIQEQTVLLLSLPTIPNIIRQVKQVCVQNFVNKKYSSAVPQRKNCKHVTFCEARLLLLVGREASADQ